MEDFFIAEFVRSLPKTKKEAVLDLDWTDDTLYGDQEGRYYNRYYGFKPLVALFALAS